MAGNIELITGHGESNHISSFDMRASNRATFGKGKYILNDAENMAVEIDASAKSIKIKSGSCVWSGMHIRIETSDTIPFVSPATSDTVFVWLHYTRSAGTLVEDVEFISTTTNKVDTSLIHNELPDDVTDAYTLFYSFTFNPEGSLASNAKSDFVSVLGMNDFFEQTTQKLNVQSAENASQIKELSDSVNQTLEEYDDHIKDVVFDEYKNPTLLVQATLSLGEERRIPLPESLLNFAIIRVDCFERSYLIPVKGDVLTMQRYYGFEHMSFKSNGIEARYVSLFTVPTTFIEFDSYRYEYTKGSLGGFNVENTTDSGLNSKYSVSVYGIGRISE